MNLGNQQLVNGTMPNTLEVFLLVQKNVCFVFLNSIETEVPFLLLLLWPQYHSVWEGLDAK